MTGDLVDSGGIFIDNNGTEGGSQLTVAGTLTNSGTLQIGNGALTADDGVTAAAVDNTGLLELFGSTANGHRATLDIAGAAGFGTAGVVTGRVWLTDDALVEFASGQLDTIASGAQLRLNGVNAFVADAGATPATARSRVSTTSRASSTSRTARLLPSTAISSTAAASSSTTTAPRAAAS